MNIKNINDTLALLRRVEELETQYKTTLFRMETWGYNLPPSIQDLEADLHNEAAVKRQAALPVGPVSLGNTSKAVNRTSL